MRRRVCWGGWRGSKGGLWAGFMGLVRIITRCVGWAGEVIFSWAWNMGV